MYDARYRSSKYIEKEAEKNPKRKADTPEPEEASLPRKRTRVSKEPNSPASVDAASPKTPPPSRRSARVPKPKVRVSPPLDGSTDVVLSVAKRALSSSRKRKAPAVLKIADQQPVDGVTEPTPAKETSPPLSVSRGRRTPASRKTDSPAGSATPPRPSPLLLVTDPKYNRSASSSGSSTAVSPTTDGRGRSISTSSTATALDASSTSAGAGKRKRKRTEEAEEAEAEVDDEPAPRVTRARAPKTPKKFDMPVQPAVHDKASPRKRRKARA